MLRMTTVSAPLPPSPVEIASTLMALFALYEGYVRGSDPSIIRVRPTFRAVDVGARLPHGTIGFFFRIAEGLEDRTFHYDTVQRLSAFLKKEIDRIIDLGGQFKELPSGDDMRQLVELYRTAR